MNRKKNLIDIQNKLRNDKQNIETTYIYYGSLYFELGSLIGRKRLDYAR